MTEQTIVRLKILSVAHTPEQITGITGLQCDRSWLIGDKRRETAIVEKCNGWILNSDLSKDASLDAHIENILGQVSSVAERIRKLSEQAEIELSCVIYSSTPPALNFEKSVIVRLNALGSSLDIDLYPLEASSRTSKPKP
jgi:hypothetical protein